MQLHPRMPSRLALEGPEANFTDTMKTQSSRKNPGSGIGSRPLSRRAFLESSGWTALAASFIRPPVMAGPFTAADFETRVPADKKLDPAWVKSLFDRGVPAVYRWPESRWIGMPIGGIGAGQLYLGGDGRLWHWDIFNQHVNSGSSGPHYAQPLPPVSPVRQGFALRLTQNGKTETRQLDHTGWRHIAFRGEYPIGRVQYDDPESPVSAVLEAFSPFIPLNAEDSSLPATVMEFTLSNRSADPVAIELLGWLENAVCLHSGKGGEGFRRNRVLRQDGLTFLECSVRPAPPMPLPSSGTNAVSGGRPAPPPAPMSQRADFGTLGLALLAAPSGSLPGADLGCVCLQESPGAFRLPDPPRADLLERPLPEKPVGGLARRLTLAPGQSAAAAFVVTWHFPHLQIAGLGNHQGRRYGQRFADALAVAEYVASQWDRLASHTRLWRDTWYDSTLPFWFLDRTMAPTSHLATNTCYWLGNGRFYGWEGVGCCAGTCTHVWHYAHAAARLFPALERALREMADFGPAFDPGSGRIRFRAEHNNHWAVDGQAGVILRTCREHQTSPDDGFLRRVWPRARKAIEFLIAQDAGADGIIDGPQHNTLDADWYGPIAWLSGLYLAALRAGEEMARDIGDGPFAQRCRELFDAGRRNIDARLFNGEYYIQIQDAEHARSVGSYDGCEIDQVLGDSWAGQVALGPILDPGHVRTALRSLWRYNYAPDVGPYREAHKPGRWYALAGEAGLLMCTWPRGDSQRVAEHYDYYFNECMTGFEYQVAGHMLREGLALEGLAIARAIHDRYHPARRNPWNEIECGDHYARAMAAYGVYLAAAGFEYHGPRAHIGFAPSLQAESFRCAFTAAEGWGTCQQRSSTARFESEIQLRWGRLRLRSIALAPRIDAPPARVAVARDRQAVPARLTVQNGRARIELDSEIALAAGETLSIVLT